jgi:hypothetical protein
MVHICTDRKKCTTLGMKMVSYNKFLYTTLAAFSPTALQETNTELFVSYSGLKYERM